VCGCGCVGGPVEAGEAEVADLEDAPVVEQQVGGLEVAVDDPVAVHVLHPAQQLLHQALDLPMPPNTSLHGTVCGRGVLPVPKSFHPERGKEERSGEEKRGGEEGRRGGGRRGGEGLLLIPRVAWWFIRRVENPEVPGS
jgi:hypothetical protein